MGLVSLQGLFQIVQIIELNDNDLQHINKKI